MDDAMGIWNLGRAGARAMIWLAPLGSGRAGVLEAIALPDAGVDG